MSGNRCCSKISDFWHRKKLLFVSENRKILHSNSKEFQESEIANLYRCGWLVINIRFLISPWKAKQIWFSFCKSQFSCECTNILPKGYIDRFTRGRKEPFWGEFLYRKRNKTHSTFLIFPKSELDISKEKWLRIEMFTLELITGHNPFLNT